MPYRGDFENNTSNYIILVTYNFVDFFPLYLFEE